jgi:hypothetical protein
MRAREAYLKTQAQRQANPAAFKAQKEFDDGVREKEELSYQEFWGRPKPEGNEADEQNEDEESESEESEEEVVEVNLDQLVDVHKGGKKFLKPGPFHDALLEIEKASKDLCTDMTIKINQRKSQKKIPAIAKDLRRKVRNLQYNTKRMVQSYLIDAMQKR